MNSKGLLILLMDILILDPKFGHCDLLSGTFFGVPLLFPYKSNCELFYNNSDYKYSFYFATQLLNQPVTLTFQTISNGKSIQVQQLFDLGKSYTSFVEMATEKAGQQSEVYSLTYNCKNKVFGAKLLFMGNPTFSVVAFFAGLTFNQSFAIYPLCIDMKCMPPPEKQYHYHVLFGMGYSKDNCTFLDGVTIQMHQETEISLQLSGKVHVLNNTVEQLVAKEQILKDQDHNRYTTLWIEPKVLFCERVNVRSLEGTKIISNKPVTVFTNRAKCRPQFSYDSQVVHQMPEVNDWGKMFITDMQQHRILPESVRNYLEYEIAIRTVHNGTTIYITYYPLSHPGYVNTIAMETTGVHRITLRHAYSHIHIEATRPVLVLYSIRSRHGTKPHMYFSVLQQPVEWYSNKQIIVLQHPTHGEVYRYHISVVIAKEHYNPRDIYIAEDRHICQSAPLLDYNGFTGNISESNGYVVFYMELMITGGEDGKMQLLLWHRNSKVYLGVTVFAYARDLQYAYGNGYTLEPGAIDKEEITCWRNVSLLKKTQLSLALSTGLLTTGLVFISALCLVSVCSGYCWLRNKGRDRLGKISQDELRLIEELHKYDALLLFADEDSQFVKHSIYQPLIREGYRVLWKYDPIFTPGRSVIESMQHAVEVCRMVVLICTKHFGTEHDQEVAYCIDIQNNKGVRKMVPITIEDECQLAKQLKKYTQIMIKTRNMNHMEHINFICKLKKDLGKPIDLS